jgi:hypothetical protein
MTTLADLKQIREALKSTEGLLVAQLNKAIGADAPDMLIAEYEAAVKDHKTALAKLDAAIALAEQPAGWAGLTEDEKVSLCRDGQNGTADYRFIGVIESALRAKNAPQQPASTMQPQDEAVAAAIQVGVDDHGIDLSTQQPASTVQQEPVATGCKCSVCGEWQRWTPSGMVCKNGHGGADGVNTCVYPAPQDHIALLRQTLKAMEKSVESFEAIDFVPFGCVDMRAAIAAIRAVPGVQEGGE